jgi:glycosyltransferase involved in cell wall biosynthesis
MLEARMIRTRLAWFSPMPPVRSGVAACSAELVPALRAFFDIDVFVDAAATDVRQTAVPGTYSAHDFVWRHQQAPYDLTIFQLGNSSTHEFIWPYLFRYPGLAVLHDAHLHHARAAALLRSGRNVDYRSEFQWNHPDANPDLAELAIAGFDTHLYYLWPMTRLVAAASRVVGVHATSLAHRLSAEAPDAHVEPIRLGHGIAVSADERARARTAVRQRLGVADDVVLFGCFGGLSPDKRIQQILDAFADTRRHAAAAHLLLAGAAPEHYDPLADIDRLGIRAAVTVTGYVESESELTASIAACDVALTLRWPTAREISGPWLRCLAAGTPTVIIHLAHLVDVPALDPRTWQLHSGVEWAMGDGQGARGDGQGAMAHGEGATSGTEPVCVAIDILDEDHSLRLAMRRLLRDAELRHALSVSGQRYWSSTHSLAAMVEDYRRIIPLAIGRPAPEIALPAHARADADDTLMNVLGSLGVPSPMSGARRESHL